MNHNRYTQAQTRSACLSTRAGLAVLLGLLAVAPAALAERNPNPGIAPANSKPYGKPYGEWSGAWWRWAFSLPADTNPVSDPTGEFAALGQSGPVWFLAGNFGDQTTRSVTVPAGKALFFPIINTGWINLPELGDNLWSEEQEEFARNFIAPFVDNAYNLSCTIDGVTVRNLESYRSVTPAGAEYLVTLPENSLLAFLGLPAGSYGPTVDDGI